MSTHATRAGKSALKLCLLLCAAWVHGAWAELQPVRYTVSLAQASQHLVRVQIVLPVGAADRDLQLPVWNALYQVRDFSQYVNAVGAKGPDGTPLPIHKVETSRWRLTGAESGATVEYDTFADEPGPYGAQLNSHHAFFNLAEILMYDVAARSSPIKLQFIDLPNGWRTASALDASPDGSLSAPNYDRLVDSPVEIGAYRESDFDESGAHYRVVVDAEPFTYDMDKLVSMVHGIVSAETAWMNDRPFQHFVFIYHFPKPPGGGGMEHAFSTAIDVNAQIMADDPTALPSVTAHEFFHAWNVKRIRPQSLEPIDYTRENYTTSLWFSEGFTSTVGDYTLLHLGVWNESQYLAWLAANIGEIETSPARRMQSAEESSLDAWLEKYDYYRLPSRSISYYHKGDLLGVLLDLKIREASDGAASLREMFQWMNTHYAQKGIFFPDTGGIRQAAEAVGRADFTSFFQKYVAATDTIPWNDFFRSVGLKLERQTVTVADPEFVAIQNFGRSPSVVSVASGGAAERAGLEPGDSILEMNGHAVGRDLERRLGEIHPGEALRLRVSNSSGKHEVHWTVGSRETLSFALKDVDNITAGQRAHRSAWLKGETQSGAARP